MIIKDMSILKGHDFMGLTQEEKEVLVKILADVRINPLDSNAAPLIQVIQSIGRKAFATEPQESFDYPAEESGKKSVKKQA